MKLKRTVYIMLVLLMLGSLAACGNVEPESPYKYDLQGDMFWSVRELDIGHSVPVKGGSVIYARTDLMGGVDYPINGADYDQKMLYSLFDEENKRLFSLCYDYTCTHDSDECFAADFMHIVGVSLVAKDLVFDIIPSASTLVSVYSLDGVLQRELTAELSEVIGTDSKHLNYTGAYCVYDRTVYMDILGYSPAIETNLFSNGTKNPLVHWVVSFDLDTEEFACVFSYCVPDPYGLTVEFTECDGERMGINYDNRYAISVDLGAGTYESVDCLTVFDEMIAAGDIASGDYIEGIFPVKGVMEIGGKTGKRYIDLASKELVELSALDEAVLTILHRFLYGKDKYYSYINYDGSEQSLYYVRESNGKVIEVSKYFDGGKSYVSEIFLNGEKGCAFRYFPAGMNHLDEQYTVTENMQEVTYQKAHKYVYVTYEDMLDDTIDEPWYYQPETGTFGQ